MSKTQFKKFKKNDSSYDDEDEFVDNRKNFVNKREIKRFERALRTKDISALTYEEDEDFDNQSDYNQSIKNAL